ncbi:DUF2177 family protein [Asticcacaulis sp. AND118]|uniref:DUF2177 family protein n=1 Tax=Asticcacaulis sp. AND118 TaxID=2840468 RepID=UPI001CFFEEF7|nr:DUF2177 family protein [Asticcacaulis sp. AND118]UDF02702.1 DUF2177 family protein [Asticcacaulis sp. AND118]
MKMFLSALVLTLIAFAVIDTVWLSLTAGPVYKPLMGDLMATRINLPAAVAFYVLYAVGVTWFLTFPALSGQLPVHGLPAGWSLTISAALLGLMAYGTYNLTALAVIRDWSVKLVVIDMIWGAVLTTAASHLVVFAGRLLKI